MAEVKIDGRGRLNFSDARGNGELQVKLAELTGLSIGCVAGLANIAWDVEKHPEKAPDMKVLLLQYLDEVFGD